MDTKIYRAGAGWFSNAYLLLVLTTLFWAGNAIAGRLAAGVISPVSLTFYRWVGASILLTLIAYPHLRRDWRRLLRSWRLVLALGGLGFGAFNVFFYWALNYTTAVTVSIEQSCMPVLILVLNYLLFRQGIRWLQVVGIVLTIAGVLLTATRGNPLTLLEAGLNRGDALMMVAIALYSGYAVALRYKPAMHWLSLLFGMTIAALLFSTPVYLWEVAHKGFEVPTAAGWAIVAYAAVFPSMMSQLFFLRAVELIGPNRAGVFINLVPMFGIILAVALLGEVLETYHQFGICLVLAGIWLAERYAPRSHIGSSTD